MKTRNIAKLFSSSFMNNFFSFSNKKKDLYQILGVNKSSSSSQIKKAYYKLAHEHHPDKNNAAGSKDKFSEINNAYEVLSDDTKRKNYDQVGITEQSSYGFSQQDIFKNYNSANGFGFNGKGQNMGFESIFQEMFAQAFSGQGQKSKKRNTQAPREDLSLKIDIDFKQSVNGTKKTVKYSRTTNCSTCKGSKSSPGSKAQKCGVCQGTGYMTLRQGIMMIRAECQKCNGEGVKITSPCKQCSGNGHISTQSQQQIIIPRGIYDGASLKLKGKGNMNGDLIINISVKRHPQFKRQGNDCLIEKQISVVDAVLGLQLDLMNIYDEKKKIKIPSGTQNGQKIKVNKQGFYKINSAQKGNMIVSIRVKMPNNLTQEQTHLYEELRVAKS